MPGKYTAAVATTGAATAAHRHDQRLDGRAAVPAQKLMRGPIQPAVWASAGRSGTPIVRWIILNLLLVLSLINAVPRSVAQSLPPRPIEAERRVALVIGISAYQNAPRLANPINDARAIGESLRRLKFDVVELFDPGLRDLSRGLREFGVRAASSDVALVYYAGHGVQVERENFMIPADARLERQRDLLYEAMPLEHLLGEVSQAQRVGIVLLDSCRNNPFIERVARSLVVAGRAVAANPGLARIDNVPRNTIVAMAAKADQIAEDGVEHSPFAAALLAHFQVPGLEMSLFFRSVRDHVLRVTRNRQEPYVFSSLGAEPFYFFPRPPNRPPEIGPIAMLEVTDAAGPTPLPIQEPTDPDQDPLTVRIVGLPRFGEIRVEGRPAAMNAVVSAERFKTATYKPDGRTRGAAGSLDLLIEDGRGGNVTASLPIMVKPSRRPPVIGGPTQVRMAQQPIGIAAPTSPDGDPIVVTVAGLPRGIVRNGNAVVRAGDRLTPAQLAALTYVPDPGLTGKAGTLRYNADNGHGDVTEGAVEIEVAPSLAALVPPSAFAQVAAAQPPPPVQPAPPPRPVDAVLWDAVRTTRDAARLEAFLRLLPESQYAAEARKRRDELLLATMDASRTAEPSIPGPPPPPPESRPMAARPPSDLNALPTRPGPGNPPQGSTRIASADPGAAALPAARIFAPSAEATTRAPADCPTCPRPDRMTARPGASETPPRPAREPEPEAPAALASRAPSAKGDTRPAPEPSGPPPALTENSPASAYLRAASSAISAGRTRDAQDALDMAQTRALEGSVPLFETRNPSNSPAVRHISQAKQALAGGDRAAALKMIQSALQSVTAKER